MKILFDQGTPIPLRNELKDHNVQTAYELGWAKLANGELLAAAEKEGFEIMITTDQNLRYQQNLADRKLAVIVLSTTSWPRISTDAAQIAKVANEIGAGSFVKIEIA
jgi:hypothetical protein